MSLTKKIEKYKLPAIKEFESTIYLIMGILNLEIFEEFKIKTIEIESNLSDESLNSTTNSNSYYEVVCKELAQGLFFPQTNTLIVKKGSVIKEQSEHFKKLHTYVKLFKRLVKENFIVYAGSRYLFNKDCKFESPSTASTIILGRSSNGLIDWKLKSNNKTLKEEFDLIRK